MWEVRVGQGAATGERRKSREAATGWVMLGFWSSYIYATNIGPWWAGYPSRWMPVASHGVHFSDVLPVRR